MNLKKKILQTISVLFIIGGVVRLFANRKIFALFQMEELWTDHLYFIYIYRVLGAFVIFTGLILFTISKNLKLYSTIFPALSVGFIIIGLVMIVSGSLLNLPLMFLVKTTGYLAEIMTGRSLPPISLYLRIPQTDILLSLPWICIFLVMIMINRRILRAI